MRLSLEKVRALCARRGIRPAKLLAEAGVSRNAFYSLARKEAVIPLSLLRLAEALEVPSSALLDDVAPLRQRAEKLVDELQRTLREEPGVEADNVRHTLLLLDEAPVERLRRALRRGRSLAIR